MRKLFTFLTLACLMLPCMGQTASNDKADNIVGRYDVKMHGEESKILITRLDDGSYQAQIYWVKEDKDKDGKKRLDTNNPDKKRRNVPCDQVIVAEGLKYNKSKQQWDGGKIYDPIRGIRANVVLRFDKDRLAVKGSLLGISETVYWDILSDK